MKVFRKFRSHYMKENKFKKYVLYALGEIVLVVIGILIALQVNERVEFSKNRKKERALLNELYKESTSNLNQLQEQREGYKASLDASTIVMRNLERIADPNSQDSILNYGPGMFRGITFDPSNGIVESLLSTGDIQHIQNDTLRNYIITWKDVLKDYQEEEMNSRGFWKDVVEPYLVYNADMTNASSLKNVELLERPEFLNMISRRIFYLRAILYSEEATNIERTLEEMIRLSTPD